MKKKIKDTPIKGKLPKSKDIHRQTLQDCGHDQCLEEVLNTELDINEIAEVDTEKFELLLKNVGMINKETHRFELDMFEYDLLIARVKTDMLKWKGVK